MVDVPALNVRLVLEKVTEPDADNVTAEAFKLIVAADEPVDTNALQDIL